MCPRRQLSPDIAVIRRVRRQLALSPNVNLPRLEHAIGRRFGHVSSVVTPVSHLSFFYSRYKELRAVQ